jgi:hypothetical protein
MSCLPYYPIQFFRSPKDQSRVLLESLFKGFPNPPDINKLLTEVENK